VNCIDWQELTEGYNRINGTNHETPGAMIEAVYLKHRSIDRSGEVLGVDRNTFRRAMITHGVPLVKKSTLTERFREIPHNRMRRMTSAEIAAELGTGMEYVQVIAKITGREYRKRGVGW